MQKNKKKNMNYSFDIKLKAVKMYLEEGIGSTTIARELSLSSNKRVLLWVKRYNEFGEDGLKERRGTTKCLHTNNLLPSFLVLKSSYVHIQPTIFKFLVSKDMVLL